MDDTKVMQFANDTMMKEAIYAYFKEHIDTALLSKAYGGEDISGAKLANELLEGIFNQLTITYGPKLSNSATSNTSR